MIRRPQDRLAGVISLQQAQRLYADLGMKLLLPKTEQLEQGIDKVWRREAVQTRKQLMERWGNMVRANEPKYSDRSFTVIKKARFPETPYITVVYNDPMTGEVSRQLDMSQPEQRQAFMKLLQDGRIKAWQESE